MRSGKMDGGGLDVQVKCVMGEIGARVLGNFIVRRESDGGGHWRLRFKK